MTSAYLGKIFGKYICFGICYTEIPVPQCGVGVATAWSGLKRGAILQSGTSSGQEYAALHLFDYI